MSHLLEQLEGRERRAECLRNDERMRSGRTGWPAGMLQDDCRALSKWLANRIDSRMCAREAMRAIREAGDEEARQILRGEQK